MGDEIPKDEYDKLMDSRQAEWEARCSRCGACCGAFDDRCVHLREDEGGRYFCGVYEKRFGLHRTMSGKEFRCVPIRDILGQHWNGDHRCAYKKFRGV